jgi:hypothetical protein
MHATIYVTKEAYETAQAIKDLDYYDRAELCDALPDLPNRPGYHLKNANKLKLAPLPEDANIALRLSHKDTEQVFMPANLRGCIFERAPNLPPGYADIVTYWSGETVNLSTSGAVYFQCQLNEYMVDLGADPVLGPVVNDRLLSEGVVVAVIGLAEKLPGLTSEDFIELTFPVDPDMLGVEDDTFRSPKEYGVRADRYERVFLKVADILASPDCDRVYIDLICNELLDYGYWY